VSLANPSAGIEQTTRGLELRLWWSRGNRPRGGASRVGAASSHKANARLTSVTSSEVFPSRPFLRYWRADAVSGLGSYITLFALQALVVLTLHGSAADVGWLNAARWLPYLVFGLVVGAIVDGRRRLPLMVGTDLLQAALLLAIPLMWWLGLLSLPALMLVVIAYGTASVVNVAAAMSLLPRLVEAQHLQLAHARIDGADAVASTAGPALGGLLVSALGAPLAVLVDSLTYVYSALTLRRIDLDEPAPRKGVTAKGLLREVADGVRWVYRGPAWPCSRSRLMCGSLVTRSLGSCSPPTFSAPSVSRLSSSALSVRPVESVPSSAPPSPPGWVDGLALAAPSSSATSSRPSASSRWCLLGRR